MDCEQLQELLSEYADDQLSPEARSDVEAHVAVCESCAGELASLRVYLQAMQDLRRVPAPVDFVDAVNRKLDAPPTWRRWVSGIFPPFFSGTPLRVAGLLASVLVVILVYHQTSLREQSAELPAPVARTTAEQKSTEGGVAPAPAPAARPSAQPGLTDSKPGQADSPAYPAQEFAAPSKAPVPSREPQASKLMEAAQDKAAPIPVSPMRKDKSPAGGSNDPIELTLVLPRGQERGGQRMKAAPLLQPESAPSEMRKEEARPSRGTLAEIDSASRESESSRAAKTGAGLSSTSPPVSAMRKGVSPSAPLPADTGPTLPRERKPREDQPSQQGGSLSALDKSADESRRNGVGIDAGKRRGMPAHVQQAIESLRELLSPLSGTILSIEQTGTPPRSTSVTLTLPSHHYSRLIRELASLGTMKASHPQELAPWSSDSVMVRIVLVTE